MSDLFKNRYRIPSARLPSWNYGSEGMYFITICTQSREPFFGSIHWQFMCLSDVGCAATEEWLKTPSLRPDMNLRLAEFVVMPNHFHAILGIGENEYNRGNDPRRDAMHGVSSYDDDNNRDAKHRVSTQGFGPQSKNLASIVRGYKSAVTTYARRHNLPFG